MMKNLIITLFAFVGFFATSCDKRADADAPSSIKRAKERSEYILLCISEERDGLIEFSLGEVLYVKQGVEVPWGVGDIVSTIQLKDGGQSARGKAVIFYEKLHGQIREAKIVYFYPSDSRSDASKLEKVISELKK